MGLGGMWDHTPVDGGLGMGFKRILGKATTAYLFVFFALFGGLCVWGVRETMRAAPSESLVGQSEAAVISRYGPPARRVPSGKGVEVLEWDIHIPGRMSMVGKIPITTPPRDEIRKAVIHGGVCVEVQTWVKE